MPEATRAGITKVHITDQDGVTLGGTGGGPATIADGADVAEGAKADAAWDGIAASASVVAILKKIATSGASAGLTDAQLRATPVPVSGTFWQVTQPVSGTFWQATQPVSIAAAVAVTGTFWQATQPVSGTVAISGSVAVTGTFWQATQPISAATLPLPTGAATEASLALLQVAGGTAIGALKSQLASAVAATSAPSYTDGTINPLSQTLAGALRVGGTVTATGPLTDVQLRATAVPVSGTFWQVTQPVSGTVTANQGTANTAANAWFTKITDGTSTAAVKAASTIVAVADPAQVTTQHPSRGDAANLCVTNTAATGVACTLTIPSAGAGLFHYISLIEIQLYATAARTGGAAPVLVTTTNLPGSPVWDFDTAQAIGNTIRQNTQPATPIKSSAAATATTIVAPIATTGIWRITAYYYAAP